MLESGPMPGSGGTLVEALLGLASVSLDDGGRDLRRTLWRILCEVAPCDAAEVVILEETGLERWALTEPAAPLAGPDLVQAALAAGAPIRLDDLHEIDAFPATRERARDLDLRSLLLVPFRPGLGHRGGLVLARCYGWAFAAVSLHDLEPITAMTGLVLEGLRRTLRLQSEGWELAQQETRVAGERDAARWEAGRSAQELERYRAEAEERVHRLEAELTAVRREAEKRTLELEGRVGELLAEAERPGGSRPRRRRKAARAAEAPPVSDPGSES